MWYRGSIDKDYSLEGESGSDRRRRRDGGIGFTSKTSLVEWL